MRLRRIFGPSGVLALLVSELFLAVICYVVALILVVRMDPLVFLLHTKGLPRIGVILANVVVCFYFQDMYEDLRVRSRVALIQQVVLTFGMALVIQALLNYVSKELLLPRWVMLSGSALAMIALVSWRILYARFLESAIHAERVVFLGISRIARQIEERMAEKPQLGMVNRLHQRTGRERRKAADRSSVPRGTSAGLSSKRPDRIVISLGDRRKRLPQTDLLDLKFSGSAYKMQLRLTKQPSAGVRPGAAAIGQSSRAPWANLPPDSAIAAHRDRAALLVLSAPVMLVVAVLVQLTSAGRSPPSDRSNRRAASSIPRPKKPAMWAAGDRDYNQTPAASTG
jgi:hypothetical protein